MVREKEKKKTYKREHARSKYEIFLPLIEMFILKESKLVFVEDRGYH